MKNKITFLKGLPASGKSTFANEFLTSNKKTVRVNKDDLRVTLFSKSFKRRNEGTVIKAERELVKYLLSLKLDVIIDNTHFNPIHEEFYRQLAEAMCVNFNLVEFNTPVQECIRRDTNRRMLGERNVGRDVILNMAWTNNIYRSPNNCLVSDMDGTLADCSHRRGYVRNLDNDPNFKKDWNKFFSLIGKDTVNPIVLNKIKKAKENGLDIIIVSARPDYLRKETEAWLTVNQVPNDRIIMRDSSDSRADEITKKEMLDTLLDKSKIVEWVDDRPKVIRMLRDNGINVTDVGNGEDF